MKCDELQTHNYDGMLDGISDVNAEYYLKSDVDSAIAELKQKLEDAKATAYAESVDAGMRERRLKRALWLARAWRAESVMEYLTMKCKYFEKSFSIDVPKCDVDLLAKWAKIIPKCRAKAEEYK